MTGSKLIAPRDANRSQQDDSLGRFPPTVKWRTSSVSTVSTQRSDACAKKLAARRCRKCSSAVGILPTGSGDIPEQNSPSRVCLVCHFKEFVSFTRMDLQQRVSKLDDLLASLALRGDRSLEDSRRRALLEVFSSRKDQVLSFIITALDFGLEYPKNQRTAFEVVVRILYGMKTMSPPSCMRPVWESCMGPFEKKLRRAGKRRSIDRKTEAIDTEIHMVVDSVCFFLSSLYERIPAGADAVLTVSPHFVIELVEASVKCDFERRQSRDARRNLRVISALLRATGKMTTLSSPPAPIEFPKAAADALIRLCIRLLKPDLCDWSVLRECFGLLYHIATVKSLRFLLLSASCAGDRFQDVAKCLLGHMDKEVRLDVLLIMLRTLEMTHAPVREWSKPSGFIAGGLGDSISEARIITLDETKERSAPAQDASGFVSAYLNANVLEAVARHCFDVNEPVLMRLALAFVRVIESHDKFWEGFHANQLLPRLVASLCPLILPGVTRQKRNTNSCKVICLGLGIIGSLLEKRRTLRRKQESVLQDILEICLSHTGRRPRQNVTRPVGPAAVACGNSPLSKSVQLPSDYGVETYMDVDTCEPRLEPDAEFLRFRAEPEIFLRAKIIVGAVAQDLDRPSLQRLLQIAKETARRSFAAKVSIDDVLKFNFVAMQLLRTTLDQLTTDHIVVDGCFGMSQLGKDPGALSLSQRNESCLETSDECFFADTAVFVFHDVLKKLKTVSDEGPNERQVVLILLEILSLAETLFNAVVKRVERVEWNKFCCAPRPGDDPHFSREPFSVYDLLLRGGWLPLLVRAWKTSCRERPMGNFDERSPVEEFLVKCCLEAVSRRTADSDAKAVLNLACWRDKLKAGLSAIARDGCGVRSRETDFGTMSPPLASVPSGEATAALAALVLFYAHEALNRGGDSRWRNGDQTQDILNAELLVRILKTLSSGKCMLDRQDPVWGSAEFHKVLLFCFAIAGTQDKFILSEMDRDWILYRLDHAGPTLFSFDDLFTHHAAVLLWVFSSQKPSNKFGLKALRLWIDRQLSLLPSHATREITAMDFCLPEATLSSEFFVENFVTFLASDGDFTTADVLVASLWEDLAARRFLLDLSEAAVLRSANIFVSQLGRSPSASKFLSGMNGHAMLQKLDMLLLILNEAVGSDALQPSISADDGRRDDTESSFSDVDMSDVDDPFYHKSVRTIRQKSRPQMSDPRVKQEAVAAVKREMRLKILYQLANLLPRLSPELQQFVVDGGQPARPSVAGALARVCEETFDFFRLLLSRGDPADRGRIGCSEEIVEVLTDVTLLPIYAALVNWKTVELTKKAEGDTLLAARASAVELVTSLVNLHVDHRIKVTRTVFISRENMLSSALSSENPESTEEYMALLAAVLRSRTCDVGTERVPGLVVAIDEVEGDKMDDDSAFFSMEEFSDLLWFLEGQASLVPEGKAPNCLLQMLMYAKRTLQSEEYRDIISGYDFVMCMTTLAEYYLPHGEEPDIDAERRHQSQLTSGCPPAKLPPVPVLRLCREYLTSYVGLQELDEDYGQLLSEYGFGLHFENFVRDIRLVTRTILSSDSHATGTAATGSGEDAVELMREIKHLVDTKWKNFSR